MSCSALVVSYHTGPRLKECLYALKGEPGISEIILTDNGNPQDMRDWLQAFAARTGVLKMLCAGDNPGFGTGVNRAARAASGEYVLVINPDAVIRRGSLAALIAALNGAPSPAIAGGRIFDLQGKEERGARRHTLTLSRALGLAEWNLHRSPAPAGPVEMGAISGAFFLMRRADFDVLGGFDEAYFLHFEDLDLCRRAWDAGGRVIYVPEAGALHYGATSDAPSAFVQAHKAASLGRYLRKFAKGPLEKGLVALAAPLMGWALRRRAGR